MTIEEENTGSPGIESIEAPVEVETESAPEIEAKSDKPISRRDTIRKAMDIGRKRLRGEEDGTETDQSLQGGEGEEKSDLQDPKDEGLDKPKRGPGRPKAPAEEVVAPQVLSAEEKQDFNKMPVAAKKSFKRMADNFIANAQRHVQKAIEKEREASGVLEAVKPYFNEWNMRGVKVGQGVAQLCAIWDDLHKNREEAYVKLIARVGLNPQKVAQLLGGGQTPSQNQNFSLPNELTQKIDSAYTFAQTQQQREQEYRQAQESNFWAQVGAGVDAARNETDTSGNYRYPQLHDQQYVQQIAPLIAQLHRADPRSSFPDLAKRAVQMVEASGAALRGQQLPQQQGQRRQITPISVRSRGAVPQQDYVALKPAGRSEKRIDTIRRVANARKQEAGTY